MSETSKPNELNALDEIERNRPGAKASDGCMSTPIEQLRPDMDLSNPRCVMKIASERLSIVRYVFLVQIEDGIATASNPKFTVSRVDIDRPGITYTIDTLRDLRAQHPDAELFFITGADAVAEIMQWKDADRMWDLAHFVAVTRPGYSSPAGVKLPEGKVDTLEIPALAISSTDVRRRARHSEPVWYLVPDGVVQYIGKHGLYRE